MPRLAMTTRPTDPTDKHGIITAKEALLGGVMVAAAKMLAMTVEQCMDAEDGTEVDREKQKALHAALDTVDPRLFPALNAFMGASYALAQAVAAHAEFHQHETTDGMDPKGDLDPEADLALLGELLNGPLDGTNKS